MPKLETVDLEGVEILEAGVRVRGVGSPPDGDVFSEDDLRGMADAAAELAGELHPPSKIGHSSSSDPAVGWLDNLRVDGAKLLADVRKVPKAFSDLIDAGAYRHRSVELRRYTSQKTEKTYPWVVSGLAWLGGQLPAVKTLDDVVKLYSGDEQDVRFVALFQEGDVVWDPAAGLEGLRGRVRAALNPGPTTETRYWVRDIASEKALVQDGYDDTADAWVVPFAATADGVEIAAAAEWTKAEQAWVQAARTFSETPPGDFRSSADGRGMPKYTDEQRRAFADATGLDETTVTDELLAAAGVPDPDADSDPKPDPDADRALAEERRQLEERVSAAEKQAAHTAEQLRLEKRRNFVEQLVRAGKILPGQTDTWEKRYDRDPDLAREFAEDLKPDPALAGELGAEAGDDRQLSEDESQARDLSERQRISREYDIPVEAVI